MYSDSDSVSKQLFGMDALIDHNPQMREEEVMKILNGTEVKRKLI